MLLCFAFFGMARAQSELTVCDGTNSNSNVPFYGLYVDTQGAASECVIPSDELEDMTGGQITAMKFYIKTAAGAAWTGTHQVYLGEVNATTLTGITGPSAFTVVRTASFDATGTELTVVFDEPYTYGGGNLLIGTYVSVAGNWKSAYFYGVTQTENTGWCRNNGTTTGSGVKFLPKTTFTYTPGSGTICSKPTLAVSDITHNAATLTVGGGSGTYNVQYKAASATVWTDVATNSTDTTFTISGLTPLTAYDVQAQSVCEGGATSDWRPASFSTTAVVEAVGDAWSDDFEGNACGWQLVNGTCEDAWVWGTATSNGGTHALYISDDGGTSWNYSHNSVKVLAAKLLSFTDGKFEFSYDWNCYGEGNYDFLRVALVPASQTLTAGSDYTIITTTSLPTGWIALDGGGKLNQVQTWQNKIVAVNVTTGNYYLVLAWRSDTSTQKQPPAAVDNVSITKLACAYDVTGLAVDGITTNSATLVWNNSEVGQWQVAYADNTSFEHATEVIVSDTTYTMTGLQPATTYYAKVRAYCGGSDFGGWSTEINLLTECVALTSYPYTENFDSYTAVSGFLPVCWDRINTGTSYNTYPYVNGYNAHSTSNCLYFYIYGSTSSTNISDQYAILPQMENLAGKQITLFAKGYNNQSTFKIGTMTDPDDATTFTAIATQELTTSYQEFVYHVPATATDSYIAILMERPDASGSVARGVYIDDISIDFPPACFKPTGLVASDPTAHGATLNWNLTDETQTAWDVQVSDTSDFSRVVVFEEKVNSHVNYMLTGLNPETQYYVRVRGNCGAEDGVSEWSSPANFTTTIACPAPTSFAVATDGLSAYTATLKWTGTSESYLVSYREPEHIVNGVNETFGTSLPAGWENKIGLLSDVMTGTALSTSSQWYFGTSNGVFDSHARINIYGSGGSEHHGWLITPTVTLTSSTFTFDLALTAFNGTLVAPATSGTDDKFVVLISTDNMETWTILRQWDNEDGSTYVYNNIANTAEGEQVSIDLSSYVGQDICIAFYGESTVSNADNNLHIDNVVIGNPQLIPATQWQTVTVDESPAILTGLTDETTYEAKLQGNCGDLDGLSEETGLITFTTLNTCPTPTNLTVVDSLLTATTAGLNWHGSIDVDNYTVRYRVPEHIEGGINETFEATSIPMDWAMYTGHLDTVMIRPSALAPATYGWNFGTLNGVFDSHARVNIYSNNQRWLVTPAFTLGSDTFTFDMALTKYSGTLVPVVDSLQQDDKFIVLISTDNMTTWTILREWNNSGSSYVYNNITCSADGEQVRIDLSAYVGQIVHIAFYGESTNPTGMANTEGDNNLHIDNVLIGNPTTVPTGEWQTAGATATDVTLTGLTPITPYEAQVKSDCSNPEEWSNTVSFTTLAPPPTVTQTIALASGSNWVSFNVDITLDNLKAALVAALPGTQIVIKAKNNEQLTYTGTKWKGNLASLDVAQMYMIQVASASTISVEGLPVVPTNHSITIVHGANWIAFPLSTSMTPTEAFAGFALTGDVIKNKDNQSAAYNGTKWKGSLTTLEPGKGYVFTSSQTSDRTLVFPTAK